jgi:hypothetical protein
MASFRAREAWRRHPFISNGTKAAFPGFRNAVIIFSGYLVLDTVVTLARTPAEVHYDLSHVHWEKSGVGERPTRTEGHHGGSSSSSDDHHS